MMTKREITEDIFQLENFLSPEECDAYLNRFMNIEFEEAKVTMGDEQVMLKWVRNNDRILLFDESLADDFWQRVQAFVPKQLGIYERCGLNEMFRVYRYSAGQRFKMHMDGSYERNENEQSFFSFLIYLSDDFEGGETEFRKFGSVQPKKGNALIFRHQMRHEGKEVLSGIKYVLRTDIMYKKQP